jgi:hypothetical protein
MKEKSFITLTTGVNIIILFFPLSMMTRGNKLVRLSLETASCQILDFEGKARANPIGAHSASFLGKLLVLRADIRLDWKVIASYKPGANQGSLT